LPRYTVFVTVVSRRKGETIERQAHVDGRSPLGGFDQWTTDAKKLINRLAKKAKVLALM
jgi:hypothetical protein